MRPASSPFRFYAVLLVAVVVPGGSVLVSGQGVCTDSDYSAVFSVCASDNTRTVVYFQTEPCTGGVTYVTNTFLTVSCECTVFDFVPVYGQCTGSTRPVTYTQTTDCTGGYSPAPTTAPCLCTSADWAGTYTDCSLLHPPTRMVVYYWPPGLTCDTTGVALPPPILNLPCDIDCDAGTYLPLGSTTCSDCPAGSFSLGGGSIFNSWSQMPAGFSSSCVSTTTGNAAPCLWVNSTDGSYISSGNYKKSFTKSTLSLSITLVKPGSISFNYRCQGEKNYDPFNFYIDGVNTFGPNYLTLQWTSKIFDVTPGFHVFEWVFTKDGSIDAGEDRAYVADVRVEGTSAYDKACSLCKPGSFSLGAAEDCTLCGVDEYVNTFGASDCLNCTSRQYSFPGATTCIARPACDLNDLTKIYGPCVNGQNTFQWVFIEPIVCDFSVYNPPASGTENCFACAPGSVRINNSGDCVECPQGTANAGTNTCTTCAAGTAGILSSSYTSFATLPAAFTTSCEGSCVNTAGWRPHALKLDGGYGYAGTIDSVLSTFETFYVPGTIATSHSSACSGNGVVCSFYIIVDGDTLYTDNVNTHNKITTAVAVEAGPHNITWLFTKKDPLGINLKGTHTILDIVMTGTDDGAAGTCTTCAASTYSSSGSIECLPCADGQTSTAGSSECVDCPANTFSVGGTPCVPCGPNTYTPPGSSQCLVNECTFSPDGGVTNYDLSPLERNDSMWGPYPGGSFNHQYFFNPCSLDHTNHSCYKDDGTPLIAYGCQTTTVGGKSLGDVMGFLPHPTNNPRAGLVIQTSHGSSGCQGKLRTANITFNCDLSAGAGFFEADVNGAEPVPCVYDFVWNSMYACPLCTVNDYTFILGECTDGFHYKMYFWLDDTLACYGGADLPENTYVPCSSGTACPAGSYENNGTCHDCEPGFYSLGGGVDYNAWATDFSRFSVMCSDGTQTCWSPSPNATAVQSNGPAPTADLMLLINLAKPGVVRFAALIVSKYPSSSFEVLIDGSPALGSVPITNNWDSTIYSYPLGVGTHLVVFRRRNGGPDEHPVIIPWMEVEGIEDAQPACEPCGLNNLIEYAPESAAFYCKECPLNTVRGPLPATTCVPCPPNTYRLPGEPACHATLPCQPSDSAVYRGTCFVNDTEVVETVPLTPLVCSNPLIGTTLVDGCKECPPNAVYTTSGPVRLCTECQEGQAPSTTTVGVCADCRPGTVAVPVAVFQYFEDESLSPPFSTWCFGSCGSDGWRGADNGLDTGAGHFGQIDVFLQLGPIVMSQPGSISFMYHVSGADELLVFIDNVMVAEYPGSGTSMRHSTVVLPVAEAGSHTFMFVFFSETGTGLSHLMDIQVVGAEGGAAVECTPCPVGFFQSQPGQTECTPALPGTYIDEPGTANPRPCSNGTFAMGPGSTACRECGAGTTSEQVEGSVECHNPCGFTAALDTTFSLTELQEAIVSVTGSGMVPIIVPAEGRAPPGVLYVSLCSMNSEAGVCGGLDTYACFESAGGVVSDVGPIIGYSNNRANEPLATPQLRVELYGTEDDASVFSGVDITFVCDLAAGNYGFPTVNVSALLAAPTTGPLRLPLSWPSMYACRECRESDRTTLETACIDGVRTTEAIIEAECWTTAPRFEVIDHKKCSERAIEVNPIYFIFIVIGVGALVVGVVALYRQNRALTYKYSSLLTEQDGNTNDMVEFASGGPDRPDDDDDDNVDPRTGTSSINSSSQAFPRTSPAAPPKVSTTSKPSASVSPSAPPASQGPVPVLSSPPKATVAAPTTSD